MAAVDIESGLVVALVVTALALVALIALLNPRAMVVPTISALSLPLFVDLDTGRPTLERLLSGANRGESETGLHVAIGLVAVTAGVAVLRGSGGSGRRAGGALVGLLMVLYSASIAVGLSAGAGWLGVQYYIQTMIPLLAWVAVSRASVSPASVSRAVVVAVASTLVLIVAAVGIVGGYRRPAAAVQVLASAIPQYRNYFPFVVMCAVALAVAGWSRHRRASAVLLVGTVVALPLMWSRTGLLMIVVAATVTFFRRPGRSGTATRMLVGIPLGVVVGYVGSILVVEGMLGQRTTRALDVADDTRVRVAGEAVERVIRSPLLGDMFVPSQSFTAGGQPAAQPLLFPAHNQYLDIALRGGVLALAASVLLLLVFLRRSWQLSRGEGAGAEFHAALCGIVVATALGGATQLYLVQPWTGALFFALLAVSSGLTSPERGVRHSRTRRGRGDSTRAASLGKPVVASAGTRSGSGALHGPA